MGIDRNITETLLGSDFESQHKALQEMGRVYLATAGFDVSAVNEIFDRLNKNDPLIWKAQYTSPEGEEWGMDTMDAFRCLVDTNRTVRLINGIFATVSEIKQRTSRKLKAIDAGTGTGIMAMALAMAGVDKIIALEINPTTAKIDGYPLKCTKVLYN